MSQKLTSVAIAKLILTALVLSIFAYGMFWLWQRQPKIETQQREDKKIETVQNNAISQLSVSPKNFSVIKEETISFSGTTTPNSIVAIFTNDFHEITDSDESGNFSIQLTLIEGLNLLELTTISASLADKTTDTLVYYLATEEEELADDTIVLAGPVSSIFDNLVSVTTTEGEKKIQVGENTILEIPQAEDEELEATQSALTNIRIGDYAVALGKITEDFLDAGGLLIIREDKPNIDKDVTSGIILTSVNDSLFSIRNVDSDIVELAIDSDTEISVNTEEPSVEDIEKDKNTVVIYSPLGEENLAYLIYIIP